MSIRSLVIADDDSLIGHLEPSEVDLLISLGDLWDASIERAYGRYRPRKVFAVRGNHDGDGPLPAYVTSVHYTIEQYGGLTFAGFGGSWRYKPKGHHLYDQEEVVRMFRAFPRVDVFISHNSPRGCHERDDEVHQGFDGLLDYIRRTQPRYFIHGHQHLNAISKIDDTQVIGVFGEARIDLG
jgi:Icc-related predicted phosphoesterase